MFRDIKIGGYKLEDTNVSGNRLISLILIIFNQKLVKDLLATMTAIYPYSQVEASRNKLGISP
ncbi:hypothetical protein CDG76_33000 [Nostoc sp. 'Peltigera membranacea cyanobiont' 210A]|nr:hypothetical protein CDG76_33000 [Nostoc sp. 'Peltigera membranacea cyanobiont' 210A]